MYAALLFFHSILRWLVLASLLCGIVAGLRGYRGQRAFTARHNSLRHWTATIAHIQLMAGMILYSKSAMVKAFLDKTGAGSKEPLFFATIHSALMLLAVVVITIGSALAKRKEKNADKYRTMLLWFSCALLLILIAIPWPFSPFAHRPLARPLHYIL